MISFLMCPPTIQQNSSGSKVPFALSAPISLEANGEFQGAADADSSCADNASSYIFRHDVLVKKKLGVNGVPLWLERCSDDHVLEALVSCSTYFEVCQQFSKQEQHDRELCTRTIREIHLLSPFPNFNWCFLLF